MARSDSVNRDENAIQGAPAIIRGILKRRLLEVWWEIGEEVLNGLVESMPQRVDALVKAEGWYTDF